MRLSARAAPPRSPSWPGRLAAGDNAAFEAVYKEQAPAVVSMLHRGFGYRSRDGQRKYMRVSSSFDVEELCQETFSQFFRQCLQGNFQADRPVAPYVMRIAANLALRRHGRSGREVLLAAPEPPLAVVEPEAERAEVAKLLAEFTQTLDDDAKAVLDGYFVDGLSQHALGDRIGLSRDQVYRTIVRIRRRAREFFVKRGWGDEA